MLRIRQIVGEVLYELGSFFKLLAAIFIAFSILNSNTNVGVAGLGLLLISLAESRMREMYLAMGGRLRKDLGLLLSHKRVKYLILAGFTLILVSQTVMR